jgi:hypothetical protein
MDFAKFRLSDDERRELLAAQTECTVGWLNSDGWPVSAFLTYVFEREVFWVTSSAIVPASTASSRILEAPSQFPARVSR